MDVIVLVKKYKSAWYAYAGKGYSEAFVVKGGYCLLTVAKDPV